MASPAWIGNAAATYDVWTFTPGGTIEAGDVFTITRNSKALTYTATGTTVASVVAGIVAAWNALSASLYPEFREYAAADGTTAVVCTAVAAGVPAIFTRATTEAGGGAADAQTFGIANTVPATGPNFWDNTANWDTGAVPVNADTPVLANSKVSILHGLAQSAVTLASLRIDSTFEGDLGLPARNAGGYQEDRATYLAIGVTALGVGQGAGAGSGRLKINTGSVLTTVSVYGTGRAKEVGLESLLWKGTHASNALLVTEGSVGVAVLPGETANLSGGLTVGYEASQETDVKLRCGPGVTLVGVTQTGGQVEINSAATTLDRTGGTMTARGTGAVTTLNNRSGTYLDESTGTITTVEQQGTYDRRRALAAKTVTTLRLYRGSKTYAPVGLTVTNPVEFFGCGPEESGGEVVFDYGVHKKIAINNI